MLGHPAGKCECELVVDVEARHAGEVVELERRRIGPAEGLDQFVPGETGTSLPVPGSGRIVIVPPVETTTTVSLTDAPAGAAGLYEPVRLNGLAAASASIAPSRPSSSSTRSTRRPRQPEPDRDRDQHAEDEGECHERRGRTEGVEIRPDRGGLDETDDLQRQCVVEHEQHRTVEVVPGQREAEEAAPKMPVQTSGNVTSRKVVTRLAPRSRAASSMWSS